MDLDRQKKATTTYLLFKLLGQSDGPRKARAGGPANGRLALSAPPPRGLQEPRLPVLGSSAIQHLCYFPDCAGSPRRLRPHLTRFAGVEDAERGPPSAPAQRGGPRLPRQDVIPARGTHPAADGLRAPARPGAASPRSHGTSRRRPEPGGPPRPQAKNKGAGAAPAAGHAHRPPRGRAPRPSPATPTTPGRAKWRPRHKMAAGWAAGCRLRVAGGPVPAFGSSAGVPGSGGGSNVPSHAVHARLRARKELAGHPPPSVTPGAAV